MLKGYLAAEGYEAPLEAELGTVQLRCGRLLFAEPSPRTAFWCQNVWENPQELPIHSIGDAVNQLRAIQRNWTAFPYCEHRRTALIAEQLPRIAEAPLVFPSALPKNPMGSFLLLDKHTMLMASQCASRFPDGIWHFAEPADAPPGRAYLKLWEALTRLQRYPQPGQRCLELGASPGSWTWALSRLGANVLAVDRAPLDPAIAELPGVTFERGNAFAMTPQRVGDVDWLFSDLICYPEKLFEFIQLWIASGRCRHFVCTLKFQGDTNYAVAEAFAAIPGSRVEHLYYNKHELTWSL
jgi:23S rRNA (cytidine2498-2'-O)-methyltransferase